MKKSVNFETSHMKQAIFEKKLLMLSFKILFKIHNTITIHNIVVEILAFCSSCLRDLTHIHKNNLVLFNPIILSGNSSSKSVKLYGSQNNILLTICF